MIKNKTFLILKNKFNLYKIKKKLHMNHIDIVKN
jgi:hypothetical protein